MTNGCVHLSEIRTPSTCDSVFANDGCAEPGISEYEPVTFVVASDGARLDAAYRCATPSVTAR